MLMLKSFSKIQLLHFVMFMLNPMGPSQTLYFQVFSDVLGQIFHRLRYNLHLLSFVMDKCLYSLQLHLHWYLVLKKETASKYPEVFTNYACGALDDEQQRLLLAEFQKANRLHAVFSCTKDRSGVNGAGTLEDKTADGLMKENEHKYLQRLSGFLVNLLLSERDKGCRAVRHLCREVGKRPSFRYIFHDKVYANSLHVSLVSLDSGRVRSAFHSCTALP